MVATELQQYFDLLLSLQGSAYCPDLLQYVQGLGLMHRFMELPVSAHPFRYVPYPASASSDSSLFLCTSL